MRKQISIILPMDVIEEARKIAEREPVRKDGLKNKPASVLRDWLLEGKRLTGGPVHAQE